MANLLSVSAKCEGKPHAAIETTKEDHQNGHAEKKSFTFFTSFGHAGMTRLTRCSWPHSASCANSVTPPGWLYATGHIATLLIRSCGVPTIPAQAVFDRFAPMQLARLCVPKLLRRGAALNAARTTTARIPRPKSRCT